MPWGLNLKKIYRLCDKITPMYYPRAKTVQSSAYHMKELSSVIIYKLRGYEC